MIYGSVCSGIEAATVAWHPLGWTPAFFAEIEKFPSRVLAHHFGSNMPGEPPAKNGIPNHGDFTKIGGGAGPVDLLVGGTPCQSFSVAGKRLGLDDPRGNLALEYLALAKRLGARWIVWENVPGVVSSVTDEEDGEGGIQSGLEGRKAGDEWDEESDFATFLEFVRECGYGFAYRILDAQFTRASGYERAVPQRRRRVFVVGYLGDWRPAAAVLFDAEGLRGNPAPRRQTGQRPAPTISSRPSGGGGLGTDFDLDGGLIASNSGDVSYCVSVSVNGQRSNDAETETLIAFNSRENPEVTFDRTGPLGSSSPQAQAIAFDMRGRDGGAMPEGPHHTANIRAASGGSSRSYVATPFSIMPMNSGKDYKARETDVAQPVLAGGLVGGNQGGDFIASNWAVRRLTPTECERLQGFPDGYTAIPGAADGPRYKALGNSMAVNVMRAIGTRIDMVENLIKAGKIKPECC